VLYPQLVLLGGTSISWNGIIVTLMAELGGYARAGAALGLNSTAVYFGALIGAPLFGAVVDATHSFHAAWLILAAVSLGALLPLSRVREPKPALLVV
jgi:predicted MFS family arabinose efflux permease